MYLIVMGTIKLRSTVLRLIDEVNLCPEIELHKSRKANFKTDLETLFNMGGIISGGAALCLLNNIKIKDVDIYFNNENTFKEAYLLSLPHARIDICFYFDTPCEYHDLTASMLTLDKNGIFEISPEAQDTYHTNICRINMHNIINKYKTYKRILKYNRKYGFKFLEKDLIILLTNTNITPPKELFT